MLERMLEVRPALASVLLDYDLEKLKGPDADFTKLDWELLEKVVRSLKPFEDATKMLSNSQACISSFIPVITSIIKNLETGQDHGVKTYRKNLKGAMETRFANAENEKVLVVSAFLDPRYKECYYRNPGTGVFAQEVVKNELLGFESDNVEPEPNEPQASTSTTKKPANESFHETMKRLKRKSKNAVPNIDATAAIESVIKNYIEEPCIDDECDPLEYWKKKSESHNNIEKNMSKVAIQYLTPPPTSVSVERLFSTAGDIVTAERNRLKPENAEKLLFLRENLPILKFQYQF